MTIRNDRKSWSQIANEIERRVAIAIDGIGGGGGGVSETRVREIIDEEIVDGEAIDTAIDTLIAAETHLETSDVESVITAELVDGQSIDNRIDTLIAAHLSGADHPSTADIESVITAELVDGQSIDNAIDTLIAAHLAAADHKSTADIEAIINTELGVGQSIYDGIGARIATELGDGFLIDNAIDALIAQHVIDETHGAGVAKANVYCEAGSNVFTLTATPTAITLDGTNSTFTTNYPSSFSVSGGVITYNDNDGLGTVDLDVWVALNGKHTADDGRPMEFRGLPYYGSGPSLHSQGVLNGETGVSNGSTVTISKPMRITLADGDTFEIRAEYNNSASGSGGFLKVTGSYTDSGSDNITTAETTIGLNTSDISDGNLTLNGDGSISIAVGGTYQVNYTIPINDDGSTGNPRSAITSHVEYDANDDGAGYVDIAGSFSQDYARETSQGEGVSGSFIFVAASGSRIRLRCVASDTTDVSTETGQAGLSLFRIPVAEDGSESGQIAPYGTTIIMREV